MSPSDPPGTTHLITLDDVSRTYPPTALKDFEPKYSGSVLALGQAVFEAQPREAALSRQRFIETIARDIQPGNLWILDTIERLTYPQCVYWPLACAFATERSQKRRFDWYLWCDDDAVFDKSDVLALTNAATEHDLKFITALPYDRMPPHQPSVVEDVDGKPFKWVKAPQTGSYPVKMAGFLLALFHRSIFAEVPEPWFGVCSPSIGFSGLAPDFWWCLQMAKAGLQPWVCCDTNVIHSGMKARISRKYSQAFYDQHGPFGFAQCPSKQLVSSPTSGAIMIEPPVYNDGRTGGAA